MKITEPIEALPLKPIIFFQFLIYNEVELEKL